MCRLMYLPANVRPSGSVLAAWMQALTKSFGGNGLGFAVHNYSRKGLDLTESDCADYLSRHSSRASVWHTRKTSCGETSDALCHPFKTGQGYLVHNGHWHEGTVAALLWPKCASDSYMAAEIIRRHGWDKFCETCDSGVWIHLTKDGRYVYYKTGSLFVEIKTGALCSEPCAEWGEWRKVAHGTYAPGEKILYLSNTPVPAPKNPFFGEDSESLKQWWRKVGKGGRTRFPK